MMRRVGWQKFYYRRGIRTLPNFRDGPVIRTEGGGHDVVVGSNHSGLAILGSVNCGRDGGRGPRKGTGVQFRHRWRSGSTWGNRHSRLVLSL
jgi:hypothetical protein